eukprot:11809750-Alexandrium_andersonii.AAC.1
MAASESPVSCLDVHRPQRRSARSRYPAPPLERGPNVPPPWDRPLRPQGRPPAVANRWEFQGAEGVPETLVGPPSGSK